MTFPSKYFLATLLTSILTQSEFVKASTQDLLVKESDFFELEKSTEITETDFFESVEANSNKHSWKVKLRVGPYSSRVEAEQVAKNLKKNKEFANISLILKNTNPQEINFFEDKRTNRDEYSWMVNFNIGPYLSKDEAQQLKKDLKRIYKGSAGVVLEREVAAETKNQLTMQMRKKTPELNDSQKIFGNIFLSLEAIRKRKESVESLTDSIYLVKVTTNNNSLNVREMPSVSSPVIFKLQNGSIIPLVESNNTIVLTDDWYRIEYSEGKFGWISSNFSQKFKKKILKDTRQVFQELKKFPEVSKKELLARENIDKSTDPTSTVASLRKELEKIKSEKAEVVKAEQRARSLAQKENILNAEEIKSLNETSVFLRKELEKTKSEKEGAVKARNLARTASQEVKFEIAKKIKGLKDAATSLREELKEVKLANADVVKAEQLARTAAQSERISSSKEIKGLKDAATSLREELKEVKLANAEVVKAEQLALRVIQAEKLANAKVIKNLKATSSRETEVLRDKNASLLYELEIIKSTRNKSIQIEQLARAGAQKEKPDDAKIIENLYATSFMEAKVRRERNASLLNELKNINSAQDKSVQTKQLASQNEIKEHKNAAASLGEELHQVKSVKSKIVKAEQPARSALQEDNLASVGEFINSTESAGFPRNKLQLKNEQKNLLFPSKKKKDTSMDIISSQLFNWVKAWESRNVSLYFSYYSKNFKDPKRSRSKWESSRRRSLRDSSHISIRVSNIQIHKNKNIINMTFTQKFKSNTFSDIGVKELVWEKEGLKWKIIKETWNRI